MRNQSKKNTKIFLDLVYAYCLQRGMNQLPRTKNSLERTEFEWETTVGLHTVIVYDEQNIWTLFSRFEQPHLAKHEFPASNPHSGKYNLHLSEKLTPQEAFDEVKRFLDQIKAKKK